jgi:hypothetical protein
MERSISENIPPISNIDENDKEFNQYFQDSKATI